MRSLLIFAALVGVTIARPRYINLGLGAGTLVNSPLAYSSVVSPGIYSNLANAHVPIPYAAPVEITSQYHAQDELGQYTYGYSGGSSAKNEVKTLDGVTHGEYSYVDPNGIIQSVNYVSDPVNGFRVAATNLPVAPKADPLVAPTPVRDTPEVAAAKEAHFAAYAEAKAAADAAPDDPEPAKESAAEEPAQAPKADAVPVPTDLLPAGVVSRDADPILPYALAYGGYDPTDFLYSAALGADIVPGQVDYHSPATPFNHYTYSTYTPYWHSAPSIHPPHSRASAIAPIPYSAPVSHEAPTEITSQYHAQDELGQYAYGYSGSTSSKSEVKTDGVTRGEYSYIDPEGKVQTVIYVADAVNGFRAAGTNIPFSPSAPVPQSVPDSPEEAAARAEHLAALEKARLSAA